MTTPQNSLDSLLGSVIQDNQDRVADWIQDKPGSWGFLAGQAILACRQVKGDALTHQERRIVWHRMWELLTAEKERSA